MNGERQVVVDGAAEEMGRQWDRELELHAMARRAAEINSAPEARGW